MISRVDITYPKILDGIPIPLSVIVNLIMFYVYLIFILITPEYENFTEFCNKFTIICINL